HALDLAFLTFAIAVHRRHVHLQRLARFAALQRRLEARNQLAVAKQHPQLLVAIVRAFHLLAIHCQRVMEGNHLVLASFHRESLEGSQTGDSIRSPPCRSGYPAPPAPATQAPPAVRRRPPSTTPSPARNCRHCDRPARIARLPCWPRAGCPTGRQSRARYRAPRPATAR